MNVLPLMLNSTIEVIHIVIIIVIITKQFTSLTSKFLVLPFYLLLFYIFVRHKRVVVLTL
jgi:hypothetical protein